MGELGRKKREIWGLVTILSLPSKHHKQESRGKTTRMSKHAQLQEERIHSQDHSFQAFYWQGLFGHFFGQVHQPAEWDKGKMRTVRGLVLCNVASSALLHYICKVSSRREGGEDREQNRVSSLRRYKIQTGLCHMLLLLPRISLQWVAAKLLTGQPGFSGRPQHQCVHK